MKDDTSRWLLYAKENLESAKLLNENHLYNPSLQNMQQCIEKSLKAILIENDYKLKKTHSITELKNIINSIGLEMEISEDDCDFFDSIYLPSKYPVLSVIPDFLPDNEICNYAINIGTEIYNTVIEIINK